MNVHSHTIVACLGTNTTWIRTGQPPGERIHLDLRGHVLKGLASAVPVRASLSFCMLKRETLSIDNIYVPTKRRATLKPEHVLEIAESMLDKGQETPILVRPDGTRYVLVEGLHRLEAAKALGETTIVGYLVQAAKH